MKKFILVFLFIILLSSCDTKRVEPLTPIRDFDSCAIEDVSGNGDLVVCRKGVGEILYMYETYYEILLEESD